MSTHMENQISAPQAELAHEQHADRTAQSLSQYVHGLVNEQGGHQPGSEQLQSHADPNVHAMLDGFSIGSKDTQPHDPNQLHDLNFAPYQNASDGAAGDRPYTQISDASPAYAPQSYETAAPVDSYFAQQPPPPETYTPPPEQTSNDYSSDAAPPPPDAQPVAYPDQSAYYPDASNDANAQLDIPPIAGYSQEPYPYDSDTPA